MAEAMWNGPAEITTVWRTESTRTPGGRLVARSGAVRKHMKTAVSATRATGKCMTTSVVEEMPDGGAKIP
jgi:hypothetical protein